MTALFPYIAFENSKEALAYYEEVFGATDVKRLEVGEEQASHFGMTKEEAQEATMHAEFEVLGVKVLCSDSFGRADKINNGISFMMLTIRKMLIKLKHSMRKLKIILQLK